MSTHKFKVKDAETYGVEKAILLWHIRWYQWVNQIHGNFIFDGKAYALLDIRTIKNRYPYLSDSSVCRWLEDLEKNGAIESIKPNVKAGDHTRYYRAFISNS